MRKFPVLVILSCCFIVAYFLDPCQIFFQEECLRLFLFLFEDQNNNLEHYLKALSEVWHFHPNKVIRLRPLKPVNGTVKVVEFTSTIYTEGPYPKKFRTPDNKHIWVTPDGEVKEMCRKWKLKGRRLRKRLIQLLGLKPETKYTHFVTFSVPVELVFRPAVDPDPTRLYPCENPVDTLCGRIFPKDIFEDHLIFFIQTTNLSFGDEKEQHKGGVPWTQLGYTYDWHPENELIYGASEYVITPNSEVEILDRVPMDKYCNSIV